MSPEPREHRIASLLPAATEACFCLGAWDEVVGVTHECDFPPSARQRPRLTRPRIDPSLPSAQLDRAVRQLAHDGHGLYELDRALFAKVAPTLIVAQTNCDVCAVTPKDLDPLRDELRPRPDVFSFDGRTFDGVLADLRGLGKALGRPDEAKQLLFKTWGLSKEIRHRVKGLDRPRIAVLDWIDPLMFAGNWIPELVDMAGGEYTLVAPGRPSRWGSWDELEAYEPDVILAAPCGRSLDATAQELGQALIRADETDLAPVVNRRVYVADGDAYFNRPGPRLVYAGGLLARALHWDHVPPLPPVLEKALARVPPAPAG